MSIDIGYFKTNAMEIMPQPLRSERVFSTNDSFVVNEPDFSREILQLYDLISTIRDPQHPFSLGQLESILTEDIKIRKGDFEKKEIEVSWRPSSQTSTFAVQTGLSIMIKLERELLQVSDYKITVLIKPGSHKHDKEINKQVNDKERLQAAKENSKLMNFINSLI